MGKIKGKIIDGIESFCKTHPNFTNFITRELELCYIAIITFRAEELHNSGLIYNQPRNPPRPQTGSKSKTQNRVPHANQYYVSSAKNNQKLESNKRRGQK